MYDRLQDLINTYGSDFITGRIRNILPVYAPTVPVFIAGNRVTLDGHEQIGEALSAHLTEVRRNGFDTLQGRLTALSIPRAGSFRAVVDWTYWHEIGFAGPTGRTTYFCHFENGVPKIDMMDYPLLAFESACDWYSSHFDPELRTGT
jgi:hypothetical protein